MTKQEEQKIVVLTSLQPEDHVLIQHGIKLALIFRKELCLVFQHKKRFKNLEQAKMQLKSYANKIHSDLPTLSVSSLFISENKRSLPEVLAENYEAILFVTSSENYKNGLTMLSESPVPFLFVHPASGILDYNRIVQPIDMRKENSEGTLWCSYFGRFNQAEIVAVAANDKSSEAQNGVGRNVVLSKKLYQKFGIKHKLYKGTRSSFRNSDEALELALSSDCNLLVLLGSSSVTPLDYVIGLPERKIIRHAGKLPVLVVNPRKDMYILCD